MLDWVASVSQGSPLSLLRESKPCSAPIHMETESHLIPLHWGGEGWLGDISYPLQKLKEKVLYIQYMHI